jgi:hypothetical protein
MRKALKLFFIFIQGGLCMNAHSDEEVIVTGAKAKYINIAVSEFEKKLDVKWENYKVSVTNSGDFILVSFSSKNSTRGLRGATDRVPGFEVKLNKTDFLVLESYFVR